jgi:hypothetical protein
MLIFSCRREDANQNCSKMFIHRHPVKHFVERKAGWLSGGQPVRIWGEKMMVIGAAAVSSSNPNWHPQARVNSHIKRSSASEIARRICRE